MVFNVDTEELSYSSMNNMNNSQKVSLSQLEQIMGLGLGASRKIHQLILQTEQAE